MPEEKALIVMLKAPLPGRVKTRLSPPISRTEAAGLYGCFITDLFTRLGRLSEIKIFAAFAPEGGEGGGGERDGPERIVSATGVHVEFFPQKGEDLGDRMQNAFAEVLKRGFKRAAMVGSDSPDLPIKFIKDALGLLDCDDLVLGPAIDGGYYLIAMKRLIPEVFSGIPWSTPSVLDETLKKARAIGLGVKLLPEWYDIDTPEDFQFIEDNLETPRSSEYLKNLRLSKRGSE